MRKKLHKINTAIMYSTLLLFPAFLNGCQSQRSASSSNELFPIYGIVLGETDEETLKRMGKAEDDLYVIHGQNFWVHDGNVFESMYLVRPKQLPLKWRNMGFDWYLTYDQWLNLLSKLGFTVDSTTPSVINRHGEKIFSATVFAVKKSGVPTQLKLEFKYNKGLTRNDEGTLYSIDVDIPE